MQLPNSSWIAWITITGKFTTSGKKESINRSYDFEKTVGKQDDVEK